MHVLSRVWCYCVLLFFFQAEDGIRDADVTGVQTCALPISPGLASGQSPGARGDGRASRSALSGVPGAQSRQQLSGGGAAARSEERRVGKECRSWLSPDVQNNRYAGACTVQLAV